MKKILIICAVIVLILVSMQTKEENYVIPNEAIRLRIIANSNTTYDQYIKNLVKVKLEEELEKTINYSNIESARNNIEKNITTYNQLIENLLENINYNKEFTIKYGINFFPEKDYKGITYKQGEYESLVITLGDGKGDNWWCVLFPPLCSLEYDKKDKIEYRLFVKDMFDRYIR